jgi:hypothetical protein
LNLKGFVLSTGYTLASLEAYSFAGFGEVEGMIFSDVLTVNENAFVGCTALKVIDITVTDMFPMTAFYNGSLNGCPNIQSIIIRAGSKGLSQVSVHAGHGSNDTFHVYVPSQYYDAVMNTWVEGMIPKSRFRKLEDYPYIDRWYES